MPSLRPRNARRIAPKTKTPSKIDGGNASAPNPQPSTGKVANTAADTPQDAGPKKTWIYSPSEDDTLSELSEELEDPNITHPSQAVSNKSTAPVDQDACHASTSATLPPKEAHKPSSAMPSPEEAHKSSGVKPSPKSTGPAGKTRMVVSSESLRKELMQIALHGNITPIQHLEIHLNANALDSFADDILAIALNSFHPDEDGNNPHNLTSIKIAVKGQMLFTQHSYHLISPAVSPDLKSMTMVKLLTNQLSPDEKAKLGYLIRNSEKAVSKALLGIRGVKKVDTTGRMESNFAKLLKTTISSSVSAVLPNRSSDDPILGRSAIRDGIFKSKEYKAKKTYPTCTIRHILPEDLGTPKLVNEKTMVHGDMTDRDHNETLKEALKEALATRKKLKQKVLIIDAKGNAISRKDANSARKDADFGSYGLRSSRRTKTTKSVRFAVEDKKDGAGGSRKRMFETEEDNGKSDEGGGKRNKNAHALEIKDMVRICGQKQDNDDMRVPKGWSPPCYLNQRLRVIYTAKGSWFVLTGKGNRVELGWKTAA
ncbi:hypothetical protein BCR34DRAFT_273136 [Clohesyomyces aquaticus]|uniref:Uncharacterized protein n=1 Tax=Clohesyomyces aquaticus TaxID=1231657 RepID=A0A1Y1ZTB6_9PLEO|nr:hypothetical protein BCR34DRAFT_273136 [Clohesyomyces aquaticus]